MLSRPRRCAILQNAGQQTPALRLLRLVGRVDAREVLELAALRLLVEALHVAPFVLGERGLRPQMSSVR